MKTPLLVLSLALLLAACNTTEPKPDDPLFKSENSFGSSTVPDGAATVSSEEFKRLVGDTPAFLKKTDLDILSTQAEAQASQDKADFDELSQAAPDEAKWLRRLPTKDDGNVQEQGNGDYLLKLGDGQVVTTLGRDFAVRTAAQNWRNFQRDSNLLARYGDVYNSLSENQRFDFPSIEVFSQYDQQEKLKFLNGISKEWTDSVLQNYTTPIIPPNITDPVLEEGFSASNNNIGDRSRMNCGAFSDKGLFKNFKFPLRSFLTSSKQQAMRGSCVAFATTAALETMIVKFKGRKTNLSEQKAYAFARWDFDFKAGDTSDGTFTDLLVEGLRRNGAQIPLERTWGYNPSWSRTVSNKTLVNSCNSYGQACSDTVHQRRIVCTFSPLVYCSVIDPGTPDGTAAITASGSYWNFAQPVVNTAVVISALQGENAVPIVLSLPVTRSFDFGGSSANPNRGFIPNQFVGDPFLGDISRGNHAVLAVGFIGNADLDRANLQVPTGDGGGYIIIKNSWGCWGDNGYGYLPLSWVVRNVFGAYAITGIL
jgi:hypothetical protein